MSSGPPTPPLAGDKPQRYISPLTLGCRCSGDGGWCRRLVPAHEGMKMRPGRWRCLGVVGATLSLWIPASARMTNSVAGDNYFRTNRSCRLVPAHQGMKSGSCGLVQRIGTVDSAEPHPDPCGGQAPRLAKSSTALHFLIPPSAIGLQFGTFRRWRAGIEVDWRAHSGTNDTHETGPPKSEQLRRPYSVFQPAPGSA